MEPNEILCAMALTRVHGLSQMNARLLYERVGSAETIVHNHKDIRAVVPDASDRLVAALQDIDEAWARAEEEWDFAQDKRIRCIALGDEDYPPLLRECDDAPLVLYWLGKEPLTRPHTVSMVGTRRISQYGKDLCASFVRDLQRACPDALVVSGLAYGVDIHCHRAALDSGLDTVAVLAHGLDTIYPSMHRKTAVQMVQRGGLLTEYMSNTNADKGNFVRRNRIVAGLAPVTIVVESARKGGALITAEHAGAYNREVCAFPGRVDDECSQGCNNLIAHDQAHLISGIDDFLRLMGWAEPSDSERRKPRQMEIFPQLEPDEQAVFDALGGVDDKAIHQIIIDTNLPSHRVSAALMELELKGLTQTLGGARYRRTKR